MNNMLRMLKLHSSEQHVDDEQYVKGAETPLIEKQVDDEQYVKGAETPLI